MLSPIEIFCCYAHQDEALLKRLKNSLMLLQRQGLITIWSDVNIEAGAEWEREINTHLEAAQIILLLVSNDFIASEYCYSKEMKRAMQRHEQKEARVIPILLRHTYWKGAPFEKLQFLPTKAKPLIDRSWTEDEALYDVVEQISNVVKELRLQRVLNEAKELAAEQHYEEALLLYEQAISIELGNAFALRGKGEILLKLERYEESLSALDQAIQADPKIDDAQFYQSKADALEKLQNYEESLVAYDEALLRNSQDVYLYNAKVLVLMHLNRMQEALEAFEQTIRLEPDEASNYELKGVLLLELRRPLQALEAYKQATKLEPDNAEYYDEQGKILLELKRYEEAIAVYEQALNIYTESISEEVQYRRNKGQALLALKRYQEALVDYEACIELGTNDSYCYFGQGQALSGLERYEEALAAYKQAQILGSPQPNPQFYHEQAVVYERLAQRAYEEEKQAKVNWKPIIESNIYESFSWFEKEPIVLRILLGHTRDVYGIAFSSDGQLLASGSHDNTIRLWNVQTGEEIHTLSGHTSAVFGVAFSPDGQLLASGSDDKTIKLWNMQTGEMVRTLLGHTGPVDTVAFSPNGQLLASGSDDKTIRLWGYP